MKPIKSSFKDLQKELFRIELIQIIDRGHSLAKLSRVVDWDRLEEVFGSIYCPDNGRPAISTRIFSQQRKDKNKVYSVHAPEVECISKGKAHKRYEFGCKVSVAATSKGGWFVGARAVHGNPYDGHTLSDTLEQVERIARKPEHVFVDMGYRGHGYQGEIEVHVDKRKRGRTARSMWRWMKPRAAIEPGIGHLKREHRMDRNRLKGRQGDGFNAIRSAAGMNFAKLLSWLAEFLCQIFIRYFRCQRTSLAAELGKMAV